MNRNKVITIIITVSIVYIFGLYIISDWVKLENQIPVIGETIEEVEAMGDWWITVPCAENKSLLTDISGTSFEDKPNIIYLIMPTDIKDDKVIFYVRDIADQYALRYEADFREGDINLGTKKIRLVKTKLPVMYFIMEKEEFYAMNHDMDKKMSADGELLCRPNIHNKVTLLPRGNSTWGIHEKKPYSLHLDKAKSVLGMNTAKKWNMISNFDDLSILTNDVFYDLAKEMKLPYTCEHIQATVYINGKYSGVYLVTSKIQVKDNRINLKPGDYLLDFADNDIQENPEKKVYFSINSDYISEPEERFSSFSIEYPKDNIDVEFIKNFVQEAFDALADSKSDRYLDYFDLDNLARFYLFEEICLNDDACYGSIYLTYDSKSNKLIFGPIWDLDNTLNKTNSNYKDMVARRSWYRQLFLHDSFINEVCEKYNSEIRFLVNKSVENYELKSVEMAVDGELNSMYTKPDIRLLYDNYIERNYEEECEDNILFYKDRVTFLDDLFENRENFVKIYFSED